MKHLFLLCLLLSGSFLYGCGKAEDKLKTTTSDDNQNKATDETDDTHKDFTVTYRDSLGKLKRLNFKGDDPESPSCFLDAPSKIANTPQQFLVAMNDNIHLFESQTNDIKFDVLSRLTKIITQAQAGKKPTFSDIKGTEISGAQMHIKVDGTSLAFEGDACTIEFKRPSLYTTKPNDGKNPTRGVRFLFRCTQLKSPKLDKVIKNVVGEFSCAVKSS